MDSRVRIESFISWIPLKTVHPSFQPYVEGFLLEIVDNDWRKDFLPFDHIFVPADKLPDPEADGDSHLTLCEQVIGIANSQINTNSSLFCRNRNGMI